MNGRILEFILLLIYLQMKLIIENANDRDIELLPVAIHYIEESIESNTPVSGFVSL